MHLRAWLTIAGLAALLVAVGFLIGGVFIYVFALFSVVLTLGSYWFSDRLAIKSSRAKPLAELEAPGLYADVRELAARAKVPMPQLYLIPQEQPNAFAAGRSPERSVVAVTAGLLQLMPREQVKGVLAHELAHIKNRDVLVMSVAATIGAAIAGIAHFLQFSLFFGGDDEDNPLGVIGTLAAIIVAPLAAMILQLAVSRQREFLADATAAEMMGTPQPLAAALGSLDRASRQIPMQVNPALETLYITNPFGGRGGMAALFSTHPPLEERIRRLLEPAS